MHNNLLPAVSPAALWRGRGTSANRHRRGGIVAAGAIVVVIGLVVHFALAGPAGDIAGDALYAVGVYLDVLFIVPWTRPATVAVLAFGLCAVVELSQLFGVPTFFAGYFPPIGFVLGSTFAVADLGAYLVGVAVVVTVDLGLRRPRAHGPLHENGAAGHRVRVD